MNKTIKATISIIAIALSGMSIAEAGNNRHARDHDRNNDRGYSRNIEKPHHARQFHQHQQRAHRAHGRYDRYRAKRHFKVYQRIRKNHSKWRRGNHHVARPVYHSSPRYTSARVSVSTHINANNALPTIAGGLIGSAIANDISHGDAGATFGGAIFGAIVGNAIAHH